MRRVVGLSEKSTLAHEPWDIFLLNEIALSFKIQASAF